MKLLILIICSVISLSANSATLIDDGVRLIKGGNGLSKIDNINLVAKAGRLSRVTQKSLTLSKIENIQNLMALAIRENRVNFNEQFKYITSFKNIKKGDNLLLKCLKVSTCNLNKYNDLMTKSPLHVQIATKFPHMNLTQINHKVGTINENIMNKYFKSTGWHKIEGEVGRNGIDGLFIKKKNGIIKDVMVVESKYNTSGLQHTNNGKQMTKQWVSAKIKNLQNKYPNNQNYNDIQEFIKNDVYRALLWNLKTNGKNLNITLKKIHDKSGKIIVSKIEGNQKMKINFTGNQEINIKKQTNPFHGQIVSWYQKEMKNKAFNMK